jgi:hypothetical protein
MSVNAELAGQQAFQLPGGNLKQVLGPQITAAASITPTFAIFHVTGATQITTIVIPWAKFAGQIIIIPDDANGQSTGTGGNIALASTLVQKKALIMTYDPLQALWYPSY